METLKEGFVPCEYVSELDALNLDIREIQPVLKIGKGRFFEVWEGQWCGATRTRVVIKKMTEQFTSTLNIKDELATMKSLYHPNLVRFYGAFTRKEPICLIMELLECGTLLNYLHGDGRRLQLPQLLQKATQVAAGMAYLEQQNYVHQSLSARNVMLTKDLVCKVTDHGVVRLLKEVHEECSIPIFLPKWTAPEALLHGNFTTKSDVWSFGIVLYEIVTYGNSPYIGMSNTQVIKEVQEGYRIPCPEHCQEKLYNIMLSCWNKEFQNRPTFETLKWQMDDYFTIDQEGYLYMSYKKKSTVNLTA